jgi:hypothetical protein
MNHKRALAAFLGLVIVLAIAWSQIGERKGLLRCENGAFEGYTLFAPMSSTTTYLIDMRGTVVHKWKDDYPPGQSVYLLDNGHLLKCVRGPDKGAFHGGGLGGLIREFDWDGQLVWEFPYYDDKHCQHHDIEPLPNGNVLILAWEKKTVAEAVAAGRDPALLAGRELWPDHVIEVRPDGKRDGRIVWEWHVWDHLIQDFDEAKANYGVVKDHPERIDVNFVPSAGQSPQLAPDEQRRLRAMGYVGGSSGPGPGEGAVDWNHTNSIAYNAELDQILLSVLGFNEIWVIDHGTTTKEAAGHTGGRCGKGGDLLYRWGNPQAYRAGTAADQQLFGQHDASWIPAESPGAGHILVFNNGRGRPDGEYTSIDEIAAPVNGNGTYALEPGGAYNPAKAMWCYTSPSKTGFFAGHISGAQRLPNGNTLICSGEKGRLFEVTPGGEIVWEYVSPFGGEVAPPGPPGGPRRRAGGPGRPPGPDTRPGLRPQQDRGRAAPPARPPGPGGPGRPPGGPPGGHDEVNAMFRATRLTPNHPSLQGRDLAGKNAVPENRGPKETSVPSPEGNAK